MDIEYLGRVLARLKPFVRDRVIRRTRLERVIGTLRVPPAVIRRELERLLAVVGIAIEEDLPPVETGPARRTQDMTSVADDLEYSPCDLAPVRDDAAVVAARRRLAQDRYITNHAKVLLRPEEEVGLAILVRGERDKPLDQGDFAHLTGEPQQAAWCLLLHNQGLVHAFVQPYAPSGMTYEDLLQHGVLGLIRAVELFDPTLGYKFSTYAMNWVRQAVTRGVANESRLIRLPVHMFERVRKVWAARARLTVDGEVPTVHSLALACGLPDDQVMECLIIGPADILSLDMPVGPEGETTLADLLDMEDSSLRPELEVEFGLLREELQAVLDTLSEREAGVVSMRFGLADGEVKTLDQIGQVYGVTRERVRQIEHKTMTKLRDRSRSAALEPYMYSGGRRPKAEPKPEAEAATE